MSAPTANDEATALPSGDLPNDAPPDLVARYHAAVVTVLVRFGDELLDMVKHQKGVDVEDVRREVLDPLRAKGLPSTT